MEPTATDIEDCVYYKIFLHTGSFPSYLETECSRSVCCKSCFVRSVFFINQFNRNLFALIVNDFGSHRIPAGFLYGSVVIDGRYPGDGLQVGDGSVHGRPAQRRKSLRCFDLSHFAQHLDDVLDVAIVLFSLCIEKMKIRMKKNKTGFRPVSR